MKKKIIAMFCVMLVLFTALVSPANAEEVWPEDPNGGTFTTYKSTGTDKKVIIYLRRKSDNALLKTYVGYGPAGEYFVDGVVMWGYDSVETDIPWHLMVSVELNALKNNIFRNGKACYAQIGSKFTKYLSPDEHSGTIYYEPHTCEAFVRHYKIDQDGNESQYFYYTKNLEFDSYFSVSEAVINNYTLNEEYKSTIEGNFRWTMLDETLNMPLDNYSATFHSPLRDDSELTYYDNRKIDIIFKYTLNHWAVNYDANGGTECPDAQTKWYNIPLVITEDVPMRTGYTFLGWATTPNATYATYDPGDAYTNNSGQTLYAVWSGGAGSQSYTVQYDANGGSGVPASQTKNYGQTLTLSSTKPTRTGYTFLGWSTNKSATYATYQAGGSYTANVGAKLYAVWKKISYTVQYDANGGSGAPTNQTKYYGDTLTLSGTKPTRTGYTFLGWSESKTATSATYQAGSSYTKDTGATLYAVWQRTKYTIQYNANGGTSAPQSQTKYHGTDITITTSCPTRIGYVFDGWSEDRSATVGSYFPNNTYSANKDTTFYAVWKKATYTVYYDANGGTGSIPSQTKTHGVNLTITTSCPTRTGYVFNGWSEDSSATAGTYFPNGTYSGNKSIVLYAVWTRISYTVKYDANGGTGAPSAQTKYYGNALTLSGTKPTRTGYTFLGWSESSSATSATYQAGGSYTANKSVTLYAVWQRISYTVSYNANGGSGAPSSQTKDYGDTLTLSSTKPTRTGYTFLGWSENSLATSATYQAGGSYTSNKSTTLYAVWKKNSYTVSYNANGGSGAPSSQTKYYGDTLTLSSTKPTRTGYTFLGWAESSSATSATYQAGGSYTANKNTTLYAVWQRISYTISYDANGGTGAPNAQTKYYGDSIILSNTVPTRTQYRFLGWSTDETATAPAYASGSEYSANSSIKLYAVWQFINYDFTVKELVVAPKEVEQNEYVNISFNIENGDKYASYSGISVQVLLNDNVIYSDYVDIDADGMKNISIDKNVGTLLGTQTVTVKVNMENLSDEINSDDNIRYDTFNVVRIIDAAVESVFTSGKYIEGTEVISSFYVKNLSSTDILPTDNAQFTFKVYTVSNGVEKVIFTAAKDNIVVPENNKSIVYFKWTVPQNMTGTVCKCKGSITIPNGEPNKNNNATEFAISIVSMPKSDTPNTRYEDKAPVGYSPNIASPSLGTSSVSWNEWIYENNTFVLKEYGITVSGASPKLAPSVNAVTATKVNNVWTMRSGYGFTLEWEPKAVSTSGKTTAPADSYTQIQYVYAMYPEFSYSTTQDKYSTLDKVSGKFMLYKNVNAANEERIHFIPIYVSDGKYTVTVAAGEVWTPAGVIHAKRNVSLNIDGSIYDDWYQ